VPRKLHPRRKITKRCTTLSRRRGSRPPTRRQLGLEPRYTAKKFRPYALAIGEATLSWNHLHVELGMLFATVSGGGYVNEFFEKWSAIRSDAQKCKLLLETAEASLNLTSQRDQKAFAEVTWLLDSVHDLADDRNTVTHAALTSTPTASIVFPNAWPGDRFAQRLEGYDVLAAYRRLRDTAILLRDYAGRLAQALARERPSWPDRPILPVRPKAVTALPQ
jgi:hypothetical protein